MKKTEIEAEMGKVIHAPIKERWGRMIISKEKPEEYREIKPYWTTRFRNAGMLDEQGKPTNRIGEAVFHVGYAADALLIHVRYMLHIGRGREKWGAEPSVDYYVMTIIAVHAGRRRKEKAG